MITKTLTAVKDSTGAAWGGANATSAAFDVSLLGEKTIHVYGTFSASVQVQISSAGGPSPPAANDASWVNAGAAITTASAVHHLERANWMHLVISSYVSGTVKAAIVGDYSFEAGGRKVSG